jgi:hypothetical protein
MTLQGLFLMGVFGATAYVSGLALVSLVQRQWRRACLRFWLCLAAAIAMNLALYLLTDGQLILHILAILPGFAALASVWMLKRK